VITGGQLVEQAAKSVHDLKHRNKKPGDKQREFNNTVKDEDALYKGLAFQAVLDEKSRKAMTEGNDRMARTVATFEFTNFDRYYQKQLLKDARQPPRPLEMDHVKPAKVLRAKDTPGPTWKDTAQQKVEYKEDFELYQENKKEQIERIELFYILEQFYERTRNEPDASSEAQQHMREYFGNPENTFFYDKNKIM